MIRSSLLCSLVSKFLGNIHRRRLGALSCKHTNIPLMKQPIESESYNKPSLLVQQHDSQSATSSPVIAQRFFSAGSTSLRSLGSPRLTTTTTTTFQDGGLASVCGLIYEGMLVVFFIVVAVCYTSGTLTLQLLTHVSQSADVISPLIARCRVVDLSRPIHSFFL